MIRQRNTSRSICLSVLLITMAGTLFAIDVSEQLPLSERIRFGDIVAVVSIDQSTSTNAHCKVEQTLKGKIPNEVTLTIRRDSMFEGYHFTDGKCLAFLKRDNDHFRISNIAPPIPIDENHNIELAVVSHSPYVDTKNGMQRGSIALSEAIKKVEMIITEQAKETPNGQGIAPDRVKGK